MTYLLFLGVGVALGLSLGLFGGGGGILAVPLLLAVGVPPDEAASTSLVVVAVGAAGGLIAGAREGRVAWREGFVFGALGIAGAMLGSKAALAADDALQLWLFSGLMVVAATMMLRKALRSPGAGSDAAAAEHRANWALVVVLAFLLGLVTGFFGVGGGFLIVPALTLALAMPMHRATSTALLVIIINSAAAMVPRASEALDLRATAVVAVAALATTFVASRWSNKWSPRALGIGFSALVFAMVIMTAYQAWQLT